MKIKLNREKELETILTICVGLVVVFFVTKRHHYWMLSLSVLLGLIGMFSKFLTAKIAAGWMKIGEMMGGVMSKVILSIVFIFFLLPLAALSRLFNRGKDNLQLKKTTGNSYYFERNHKYEAKDLKNSW
jgi:hypothetical protein